MIDDDEAQVPVDANALSLFFKPNGKKSLCAQFRDHSSCTIQMHSKYTVRGDAVLFFSARSTPPIVWLYP